MILDRIITERKNSSTVKELTKNDDFDDDESILNTVKSICDVFEENASTAIQTCEKIQI